MRAAALLAATLALGGCAGSLTGTDGAKVVTAHPVPSYQIHEECFKLNEGDRVDFGFESSEPVDFNIHYLEGQAVVMPISREKARSDAGVYVARIAQDYCLMWESGAAGALIGAWGLRQDTKSAKSAKTKRQEVATEAQRTQRGKRPTGSSSVLSVPLWPTCSALALLATWRLGAGTNSPGSIQRDDAR